MHSAIIRNRKVLINSGNRIIFTSKFSDGCPVRLITENQLYINQQLHQNILTTIFIEPTNLH
jgi:hypothetical protein